MFFQDFFYKEMGKLIELIQSISKNIQSKLNP